MDLISGMDAQAFLKSGLVRLGSDETSPSPGLMCTVSYTSYISSCGYSITVAGRMETIIASTSSLGQTTVRD